MTKRSLNKGTPGQEEEDPPVPHEIYERHILRARNTGNTYSVHRDYVLSDIMSRDESYLIQDIINHMGAPSKKDRFKKIGNKTFFLCTNKFLWNSQRWTDHEQKTILNMLKARGYILTKKLGIPPCRYVFVNIRKIESDLDEAMPDEQTQAMAQGSHTGESHPNNRAVGNEAESNEANLTRTIKRISPRKNKKNTTCSPSTTKKKDHSVALRSPDGDLGDGVCTPRRKKVGLGVTDEEPNQELSVKRQWADLLYTELKKVNKIMRRPKSTWANDFDKLEKELVESGQTTKDSQSLIWKVLRWYTKNIGKDFVPDARSASAFCDKFENICAAMERAEKDTKDPYRVPTLEEDPHRW